MNKQIFFLVLFLFSSFTSAEPELKGSPSDLANYLQNIPTIIEVIGQSEIDANADNAIVTLVVKTENKMLSGAIKSNQSIRNKITTYLTSKGLKDKNITSSKFSSTPEYGFFGNKPDNYKVDNVVLLTINSEKELLFISEVVDKFQEVFLVSTTFEHSEHEKYKKLALKKAIDNALDKKTLYEKTLGTKLYVKDISENTIGIIQQTEDTRSRKALSSYSSTSKANFGSLTYQSIVTIKYSVK